MSEILNMTSTGLTILTYLSRAPDSEFYVRELAKLVGFSVGGCQSILGQLQKLGLVEKRSSGRNVYYKISTSNPSVKFFKIFINIQEVNKHISKTKKHCRRIVLFGSCATGDDTWESDIDLLMVTEMPHEVKKAIKKKIDGRIVRMIVVRPSEVLAMKSKDPAFYEETSKGIELWRETNE